MYSTAIKSTETSWIGVVRNVQIKQKEVNIPTVHLECSTVGIFTSYCFTVFGHYILL